MIISIKAKQILNSRRNPTVEVELETDKGVFKASVPSGASQGKHEAKTVKTSKAIKNINQIIAPKLIGKDPTKQKEIDKSLAKKLGANAILPVSIAVCRAGARAESLPLYKYINKSYRDRVSVSFPKPCVLLIEGGLHAKNKLDFQEFMIIEEFEQAKEIYQKLGKILNVGMGLEGGFAPKISNIEQALDLIMQAAGGAKLQIGLDCAGSHFKKGKYTLDFYQDLVKKYPIVFLEDPFGQDNWKQWRLLKSKIKTLIIGDDLTVTNKKRLKKAIKENCIDGLVIKPNQIGTITETLECVKIAKKANLKIMVSHRAGETMDDFIADLAVGIGADFIKSGGPFASERLAKYKRLAKIEKEYG